MKGNGWEVVEAKLPVLVTVLNTANHPRGPAVKRMLRYKRARVEMELAGEVKSQMRDASDADRQIEIRRRTKDLEQRGLLIQQWDLEAENLNISKKTLDMEIFTH